MKLDLKLIYQKHKSNVISKNELKILIQEMLKVKEIDIFLNSKIDISIFKYLTLKRALKKLSQGYPLAYILGYTFFGGNKFKVTPDVLIPRFETEELVQYLLTDCKAPHISLLDIGTGSGIISISLKSKRPKWNIAAIDISKKALKLAEKNALNVLSKKDSIQFILVDVINYRRDENHKYDIIVSNPPYISIDDPRLDKRVEKYEPQMAIFAEENGLAVFKAISNQLAFLLKEGGKLFLEFGEGQGQFIQKIFSQFDRQTILPDINGKERFFCGTGYKNQ